MGLEVRGVTIYSLGEWHALARSYADQSAETPAVLAAWFFGERVEPLDIAMALSVEARLIVGATERTHELLDLGLRRLAEAFLQELG
jgi:hypothetical protein